MSKHIHALQKKPKKTVKVDDVDYYVEINVVCKKRYSCKSGRSLTNFIYKITNINNQTVTLLDKVEETEITVDHDVLSKHFKLPYCSTAHSYQGLSTSDKITIFDCNLAYVDPYFIWTSTHARQTCQTSRYTNILRENDGA